MEYRTLGKTGIRISAIGMGCEGFEGKSAAECVRMVDCTMACGINFIEIYSSNPVLRENLGRAFAAYPRESFVVQGHIGSTWQKGQYKRTRNVTECKAAFEDFMQRMQLNYVDVGCLHYCDDDADFDTIFQGDLIAYARELKAAGTIRAIGLSTHNTNIARRAAETGLVDVILFSMNPAYDMIPATEDVEVYFNRHSFHRTYEGIDPERARLYELCQVRGVALIVMKAFAGGLLLDKKQTPFGKALTPMQCLHYCLTRPAVASVMVGAHSPEEFAAAAAYAEASDADRDYAAVLSAAPGSTFHGHCMYCGHCAPCPKQIDVASVCKYLDLALAQGFVPETVREHYEALPHPAGECIACGSCVKNCPFGVDVIGKMKTATAQFGK